MCDKVSVLIPAYNRSRFIGECIESILRQTYNNIEIIVYDDGSTDNTVNIARSFGNINVIEGNKNMGVSYARNRLLEICNTEYAAWHDSDDVSNVYRIEEQYYAIKNTEKALCYCNWQFERHSIRSDWHAQQPVSPENESKCMGSSFINVKLARKVPFEEAITMGGEDLIWRRAMEQKYRGFVLVRKMLYHVRLHNQRISTWKNQSQNRVERLQSDQVYEKALGELG